MNRFNLLIPAQFPIMQYFSAWLSNILNAMSLNKKKPYLHQHQRLGSSWLSDKMNLSELWKDLFKMVMVDKAVVDCFASILTHILKIQDPSQILLGTCLLFFFSPFTPVLIQAPDNPIHHTRGPIAVLHFQWAAQSCTPKHLSMNHCSWKRSKIKSNHEPSTILSITEQYQRTSPGCSTYSAHLQWIPW